MNVLLSLLHTSPEYQELCNIICLPDRTQSL